MSDGKFFGRQSRGLSSVSKVGVALISLQTNGCRRDEKKETRRTEKKEIKNFKEIDFHN